MKLTKDAALKSVRNSKSLNAIRFSNEVVKSETTKQIKDLQREIENRLRRTDLTILIVE